MNENPPSFDAEPVQMTGGIVYCQANDGRWYAVRNTATGELMRWPSMAALGLPEGDIRTANPLADAPVEYGIGLPMPTGGVLFDADPQPNAPVVVEAR